MKEKTIVSMVEGKGGLLFVCWWSSFSFFEISCGRLFSNHAFDQLCNLKFEIIRLVRFITDYAKFRTSNEMNFTNFIGCLIHPIILQQIF
jgi:hypothetical protein